MLRKLNDNELLGVIGGSQERFKIEKFNLPKNRTRYVVLDTQTKNWVGCNGVEYLPGTFTIGRNTHDEILEVADLIKGHFEEGTIGTGQFTSYTVYSLQDGKLYLIGYNERTANKTLMLKELPKPMELDFEFP